MTTPTIGLIDAFSPTPGSPPENSFAEWELSIREWLRKTSDHLQGGLGTSAQQLWDIVLESQKSFVHSNVNQLATGLFALVTRAHGSARKSRAPTVNAILLYLNSLARTCERLLGHAYLQQAALYDSFDDPDKCYEFLNRIQVLNQFIGCFESKTIREFFSKLLHKRCSIMEMYLPTTTSEGSTSRPTLFPYDVGPARGLGAIYEQLIGEDIVEASYHWGCFVQGLESSLQRTIDCLLEASNDRRTGARLNEEGPMNGCLDEELLGRLNRYSDIWSKELCHIYLHLVHCYDVAGDSVSACDFLGRAFSLDQIATCLDDDSIDDLLAAVFRSATPDLYRECIPANSPKRSEIVGYLDIERNFRSGCEGIGASLNADPPDTERCLGFCDDIARVLGMELRPALRKTLGRHGADIARRIKSKRDESMSSPLNEVVSLQLTRALLCVTSTKRLRDASGKPTLNVFELAATIRRWPILLSEERILNSVRTAIQEASTVSKRIVRKCVDSLDINFPKIILLPDKSARYEFSDRCQSLLDRGGYREALSRIEALFQEAARASASNVLNDRVLLTQVGEAYLGLGDLDKAESYFTKARDVDPSVKNQAMVLHHLGNVYLSRGLPRRAAEFFEESYSIQGENGDVGTLVKAATALRLAKQYDRALMLIRRALSSKQSARDEKPYQTRTVFARTLWSRYCDWSLGGSDDDVRLACQELSDIITGSGTHADRVAIQTLIDMVSHPIAKKTLDKLLRRRDPQVQKTIIKSLSFGSFYDPDLTATIISLVPRSNDWYWERNPLLNVIATYLVGAWTFAYFNEDRESIQTFVAESVRRIFARNSSEDLWVRLLSGTTGLMRYRVSQSMRRVLRQLLQDAVRDHASTSPSYLRDKMSVRLLALLETRLLGLVSAAYSGREPGISMRDACLRLLGYWPTLAGLRNRIDTALQLADFEHAYCVSEFQYRLANSFLNQVCNYIGDVESPFGDLLERIALNLRDASESVIRLELHAYLKPGRTVDEYLEAFGYLVNSTFFANWRGASEKLLPSPVDLECRSDLPALILSISLWSSQASSPHWQWGPLYSYAVDEQLAEREPWSRSHAKLLLEKIAYARPLDPRKLSEYILAQLDGMFARSYSQVHETLRSPIHTIKNQLLHLSASEAEATELEQFAIAVQLQELSNKLLEPQTLLIQEFDLLVPLSDLMTTCGSLIPKVTFELRQSVPGDALIVRGSKDHIVRAIWDILHNAMDAINALPTDKPRNIRLSVAQGERGVHLGIANTGLPNEGLSNTGLGIGSQNVNRVIREMHKGSVSHGPISEPPFQYEWRMFLPFDPIPNERGRR